MPANRDTGWSERTPWGDPDLQGEWTTEGEYGVPFERPVQYGTRQYLTDAEYATRMDDVRSRDERDLARVDVLSGKGKPIFYSLGHFYMSVLRDGRALPRLQLSPSLARLAESNDYLEEHRWSAIARASAKGRRFRSRKGA